jgi:hypothetical protein
MVPTKKKSGPARRPAWLPPSDGVWFAGTELKMMARRHEENLLRHEEQA